MITLLLIAILVALIMDIHEHRDCRDETWLVLQHICLSEWQADQIANRAVTDMLDEARRSDSASRLDDQP